MQTEQLWESHLDFHIVDVRREAEDDFSVVCVVFTVSNVDVHINLVFACFDQHAGEKKWKVLACLVVMHTSPHKGAVVHWKSLQLMRSLYSAVWVTSIYNNCNKVRLNTILTCPYAHWRVIGRCEKIPS